MVMFVESDSCVKRYAVVRPATPALDDLGLAFEPVFLRLNYTFLPDYYDICRHCVGLYDRSEQAQVGCGCSLLSAAVAIAENLILATALTYQVTTTPQKPNTSQHSLMPSVSYR
jgi:hypothetical protein